MRTRPARVGPKWFELRDALAQNGVVAPNAQLADGIAEFVLTENMLPLLVRRAQRNQKRRGLFR